jgi:hypothetical protein
MYSITTDNNTFLGTALTAVTPQELLEEANAALKAEMTYWSNLLLIATDNIGMFKTIQHCLEGLEREAKAMKDVTSAIQAEQSGLCADASVYYARAQSDLQLALSSWHFAIADVADDSPFDIYMPTSAERKQYEEQKMSAGKLPTRTSYAAMQEISPMLHHVYLSMDRVYCLGLSLTQYQMRHLTTYLIEAKQQQA